MLEPTQVAVHLVTRDQSGSDAARDRPQLAVADQRANVVLGAAELGGKLSNRQRCGPLHPLSIAARGNGALGSPG